MKNIALIFAGGTGRRMCSASKPKQFLILHGKPLIIYTIEIFSNHPQIDAIVVVCLKDWIGHLESQIKKFDITKPVVIVAGGATGQESIFNGLTATQEHFGNDCNVLIHDGVRPLINEQTVTDNIEAVNEFGSCITCVNCHETILVNRPDGCFDMPPRASTLVARAPQTFRLPEILDAHRRANESGKNDFIDSCSMMNYYGHKLHTLIGPTENIKITTASDFYVFKALVEVRENRQIFGL